MAERITSRRCIICGGLIVGRGVPVWTHSIGLTQFIGQRDAPFPQGDALFPLRWAEAHKACSHVLEDEDDDDDEGGGRDG